MANYPQLDDCSGVWTLKEVNDAVMGGYWRNYSTRGIFAGGEAPGGTKTNVIQYITIASTGNAADFGDLIQNKQTGGTACSHTKIIFGGGKNPSNSINEIGQIIAASTGNESDFGDLTRSTKGLAAASNSTRAVFGADYPGTNVIDYITMTSTGNAIDFGDITVAL